MRIVLVPGMLLLSGEAMFIVIGCFVLFAASEGELLPLNETVLLNSDTTIGEESVSLFEACELVFSVRSVTRQVSITGWASEMYCLEVDSVFKGDLDLETVSLITFPYGINSSQLSSLQAGQGIIIFASPIPPWSF